MDWNHLLFSFEGRVNRAKYWLVALINIAVILVVAGLALVLLPITVAWIIIVVAVLTMAYIGVAVGVKRLHDRNKSGWWLLLYYLVPGVLGGIAGDSYQGINLALNLVGHAISLWGLIDLGFLRGTAGSNDYGPDPLEEQA
jgi:uncharacterized membrane protein YhaH (DUF805 family)